MIQYEQFLQFFDLDYSFQADEHIIADFYFPQLQFSIQTLPMLFYSLLLTFVYQVISVCDQSCASCSNNPQNDNYCLACIEGYTQLQTGLCIPENIIANCVTYDQSSNCLVCKPTFQMVWNICQRTFAGCLIFKNNKCFQCMPGAFLNNMTGVCSVQYLNCISINSTGRCTACQARYILKNGRCTFSGNNCVFIDKNTGLCAQCSSNSILIGTTCVFRTLSPSKNCYLIDDNSLNISCKYCKKGYGIYQGSCITFSSIINRTQNLSINCSDPEYLQTNQAACTNTSMSNCQIIDFGLSTCVFCNPGYDLINGTCSLVTDNFCLTFAQNSRGCQTCKQTFFLRNGTCIPFPPYCTNFSSSCTQCQSGFNLIYGNCIDPYCQTANPITKACQICQANYKLNPFGVCKFMDPNCLQFNEVGNCVSCMKGYSIRSSLQFCAYQDLNCLIFNNVSGGCKMCKPFFTYNQQVQLCVPLPDNCQTADLSGKCSRCLFGYNLVSNFTCLFISSVPNCQMINKDDFSKCVLCTNGSYANKDGVCKSLPPFCALYDTANNQCQQCQDNGLMRNGNCVDKNCQIFDLEGGCLACIASYKFNSFGQCIFTPRDPNCNNFVFGICQSCKERYYFDFEFVCTPVSPLCRSYDANSGYCLTCYDGYELNLNGGCFLNIYNSIVGNDDLLSSSCKRYNKMGECIECYFGYEAIKMNSSAGGVDCIQNNDQIQNTYCIKINKDSGKCTECVYRMFLNASGECQSIDENCNDYNKSNGECIACYPGYTSKKLQNNRTKCVIIVDADPNCQIKGNGICNKCYSGFYYSVQSIKCVQVNQLCQTYNQTTGDCLSCYSGYVLQKKTCKVQDTPSIPTSNANKSNSIMPMGCNQVNSTTKQCTTCDWGYALINGNCIQRDLNCEIFLNANSLTCISCYSGYKTFGNDQTKCVLSTLIVDRCIKYSPDLECLLCENGYFLSKSLGGSPSFVCNVIDQNCALFNTTLNECQKCVQGSILSGRFCIVPTYGIDENCSLYTNKLCTVCKNGYALSGYLCAKI